MAILAIMSKEPNADGKFVVLNTIVPPKGATAFFIDDKFFGVEALNCGIGDIYDPKEKTFSKPVEVTPE